MMTKDMVKETINWRKGLAKDALFDYFVALSGDDKFDELSDNDFDRMVKKTLDIADRVWYNEFKKER